jgi:RimJ/RimL family protein N-acetyltransferase
VQRSYRIVLPEDAYMRTLCEEDVTVEYVRGLNDPLVHRFLVGPRSRVQTIESVRAFVRRNRLDSAALLLGMFVRDTLRGTVRLHDISEASAFLGLAIFDRALWGQGWGTRCVEAATRFAQAELRVSQVAAVIEPENIASIKAFQRVGYARVADKLQMEDGQAKQLWVFASADAAADIAKPRTALLTNGDHLNE